MLCGLGAGAFCALGTTAQAQTSAPPYIEAVSPLVEQIRPYLTVGEGVDSYRLVGLPDGQGAFRSGDNAFTILVNHELTQTKGVPRVHGGTGAFVSRWKVNGVNGPGGSLKVKSGADEILEVFDFDEATFAYKKVDNRRFSRLCSAYLALPASSGFSRPIFLTGEESDSAETLDGIAGGQSFAVFDNKAYALPRLGRYAKENQVSLKFTGPRTVIIGLEDGPRSPDSQLYMYVGHKNSGSSDVLEKNGLSNGSLYVAKVGCFTSEEEITSKNEKHDFILKKVNWNQDGAALEAESDAKGATGFIRIEDGAVNPRNPNEFYFVTTGTAGSLNPNGRLYKLTFHNRRNPLLGGTL